MMKLTKNDKDRLDVVLVDRGFLATRSKARDAIKRGAVTVGGVTILKPGHIVPADAQIDLAGGEGIFVSRGALKLMAALDAFDFDPAGRACLDIGASTGGFTQLLLQRGAAHVTAVDVGHGQLHRSLAEDERVTNLEGTDARTLTSEQLTGPVQAITADVSFISLTKALKAALSLAQDGAWLAALVKPQFEVGPEYVGKGGIVREEKERLKAIEQVCAWVEEQDGWHVIGTTPSPIAGQNGNQETLLGAIYSESSLST